MRPRSSSTEIVKQWTDVHGLPVRPSAQAMVDGYPRQTWVNETGEELIESYTVRTWRTVRRSRRVKRITNAAPPVHSCSRSEFLLPITSRDSSALRTLA